MEQPGTSPNHNSPNEKPSIPSHPTAKTIRLGICLISFLLALGIAVWKFFPHLFGKLKNNDLAIMVDVEDPRSTYKGPFQNIDPDVKYVGTKACGKCHSKEFSKMYAQTPMGRSLIPMATLAGSKWYDNANHNPFKAFDSLLSIDRQGERVWHSQAKLDEKGKPIFDDKREVHYAIGSGNHGHSFLSLEGDGYLFQTPISWFGKEQQFWDVSPGFASFHRRPVSAECMFCHTDRAVPVEDYENRFQIPVGGWHAIGCERCHGPGEKHINNPGLMDLPDGAGVFKQHVTKADVTIVNPGKLIPELAEAVCQQCHLEGEIRLVRRGRGLYDYRPGLPLDLFWSVFVDGRESGEDKKAVNHVEQMVLSRCFQRSTGDNKLGCLSCHDPHHVPVKKAERLHHFRQKCWKCHAPADRVENDRLPCKLPLPQRQLENQDNCLACHMPPYDTSDIAHTASTDHRILRLPKKQGPARTTKRQRITLAHFHRGQVDVKDKELARDLGIALSRAAIKKNAPASLPGAVALLEKALRNFPDDLEAWEEKGAALYYQGRFSEALAALETVLAKKPQKESALARAAFLAQNLGKEKLCMDYWKKAAAMNPWIADYQGNVTSLLVHKGTWDEVGGPSRKWLDLDPGNPEPRKILIEYFLHMGNTVAARQELARLHALRPAERANLEAWFQERSRERRH